MNSNRLYSGFSSGLLALGFLTFFHLFVTCESIKAAEITAATPESVIVTIRRPQIDSLSDAQLEFTTKKLAADKFSIESGINKQLQGEFNQALLDLNNDLSDYTKNNMVKGFADANAMAANVTHPIGIKNLGSIFFATGGMLSVQNESTLQLNADFLESADLAEKDMYMGLATSFSSAMVGLNINNSLFLESGGRNFFYLKYGNYETGNIQMTDQVSSEFNANTYGFGAYFDIVKPISFIDRVKMIGGVGWTGLSLGFGYTLQKNNIYIRPSSQPHISPMSPVNTGVADPTNPSQNLTMTGDIIIYPEMEYRIESYSETYSLELTTGLKVFIVNFNLGLGFDVNSGKTKNGLDAHGVARVKNIGGNASQYMSLYVYDTELEVKDSVTKKNPTLLRPKLLASSGINIGYFFLDIPVVWYPVNGIAAGITVGATYSFD